MKKIKLKRTSILWLSMLLIILAKSDALIISMQLPINNMVFFTIWHILPIVFVLNFSILFSIRRKPIFLFVIDFAISFIFFVDMIYARGYGHLISVYMIFAKGITEGMGPSVISLIHPTDFLMFVDLPFVFLAVFKLRENNGLALPKRIALFASTMLLTTALFGYQLYQMRDIKVLANYTNRPLYLSPIGTHIFDIYRFVYERNEKLNSKEVAEVDAWLKDNSKYQQPDPAYKYLEGKIKGKNLIVIQVESLESVVLNKSYYNQEITPNLNKLIGKSIYFSNINEQVKDGNSSDAELIFNTSTYPISSGSAFIRFGDNTYNSIPKLLNNYGYSSVAMHGDD
ncbi:MAG: LTA synthase family protein, partial [Solirubrobacterales bacterium]